MATNPILSPRKLVDFKNMARLATLPAQGYTSSQNAGKVVIYLPHLPEDIELPRDNNYDVTSNMIMPDGLFIYRSTNPLEINLAFTLHAYDDLCPEGPKTLLDIAARLSALTLPASNDVSRPTSKVPPAASSRLSAPSLETSEKIRETQAEDALSSLRGQQNSKLMYPPACSLRLVQAGSDSFGIHCVGFVKSATPILHGPWLQTTDGSNEFNLPSACTYKFTFVHNPSYTGTLEFGKLISAYGPDVFERLYNTHSLAALTNNTYADIEDLSK